MLLCDEELLHRCLLRLLLLLALLLLGFLILLLRAGCSHDASTQASKQALAPSMFHKRRKQASTDTSVEIGTKSVQVGFVLH
jgi:hypothetical protein